jgi:hypothetical protein
MLPVWGKKAEKKSPRLGIPKKRGILYSDGAFADIIK